MYQLFQFRKHKSFPFFSILRTSWNLWSQSPSPHPNHRPCYLRYHFSVSLRFYFGHRGASMMKLAERKAVTGKNSCCHNYCFACCLRYSYSYALSHAWSHSCQYPDLGKYQSRRHRQARSRYELQIPVSNEKPHLSSARKPFETEHRVFLEAQLLELRLMTSHLRDHPQSCQRHLLCNLEPWCHADEENFENAIFDWSCQCHSQLPHRLRRVKHWPSGSEMTPSRRQQIGLPAWCQLL